MEYAWHEQRLDKKGSDGQSLRQATRIVLRQRGVMPEEGVNPAEFPELLRDVWRWFVDLDDQRSPGFSAAAPFGWSNMQAYFYLTRQTPGVWEVEMLRRLDTVARNPSLWEDGDAHRRLVELRREELGDGHRDNRPSTGD